MQRHAHRTLRHFQPLGRFANARAIQGNGADDVALRIAETVKERPSLTMIGMHMHIGSQITTVEPYAKAVATPEFQAFLKNYGAKSLNLSGDEASQFLNRWQSVTTWSMYKAKAIEISPDSVGIAKP